MLLLYIGGYLFYIYIYNFIYSFFWGDAWSLVVWFLTFRDNIIAAYSGI